MNFVSMSKAYNLRYYIDFNGEYGSTSLEFINVITRKSSDSLVNEITDNMLRFKIESLQKLSMISPLTKQLDDISRSKTNLSDINIPKKGRANDKEDQILF